MVSIILGLGILELLTGLRRLIQARARVRVYWPVLGWVGLLLVIHVQTWWTMFGLRTHESWNFFAFLIVLMQPIVLYLLAALVLPDFPEPRRVDLKAHYYAQTRWFFGFTMLLIVVSLVRPIALGEGRQLDLDVAMQGVFFLLGAVAATTRRAWFHELMIPLNVVLIGIYIAMLFTHLR